MDDIISQKVNMVKQCLYLPTEGAFDSFDNIESGKSAGVVSETLIADSDSPEFHIGQSYENKPAQAVFCTLCGRNQFYVGKGSYYTAIKCSHCEWELCIHEG